MGSNRPRIFIKLIWVLVAVYFMEIPTSICAEIFQDTDLVFDDIVEDSYKIKKNLSETTTINLNQNKLPSDFGNGIRLVDEPFNEDDFDENNDESSEVDVPSENDSDDDSQSASWLIRGVNRVKRQITRLLGADEQLQNNNSTRSTKKNLKNKKKNLKHEKRLAKKLAKQSKTADSQNVARVKLNKGEKLQKKRDIFGFDFFRSGGSKNDDVSEAEGSGNNGDDDNEPLDVNYYRTMFTLREPWSEGFKFRASNDFQGLQTQIKKGFEALFVDSYNFPDQGSEVEATLVEVGQTSDRFQIHLTVDLKVKGNFHPEEIKDTIKAKLQTLHLGDLLVQQDNTFSFTKIMEHEFDEPSNSLDHHHDHTENVEIENECESNEFQCVSTKDCIPLEKRCDNTLDCDDASDEENCEGRIPQPTDFEVNTWQTHVFEEGSGDDFDHTESATNADAGHSTNRCDEIYSCPVSGQEICHIQLCDGVADCPHGEDEYQNICADKVDFCKNDEFKCESGGSDCIPLSRKCDGYPDCPDSSDEMGCADRREENECRDDEFACDNGQCHPNAHKCDGRRDCEDGSDESECRGRPTECSAEEIACDGGTVCIHPSQVCDGRYDCNDNFDEANCNEVETEQCTSDEFACGDGQCVGLSQKCDGFADCTDGSDEADCRSNNECRSHEYQCRSGECISRNQICDNHFDCRDRDDEDNCPNECSKEQYQCRDRSKCISKELLCDGDDDCPNADDEENCDQIVPRLIYFCPDGQFTCRDLSCIPITGRCDGKVDCPMDRMDEEDCPCLYDKWQCDDKACISIALRCNGNIDCPNDVSDERNCDKKEIFVNDTTTITPTTPTTANIDVKTKNSYDEFVPIYNAETACKKNSFKCKSSGLCLPLQLKCDGKVHCNDFSDEENCHTSSHTTISNSQFTNYSSQSNVLRTSTTESLTKIESSPTESSTIIFATPPQTTDFPSYVEGPENSSWYTDEYFCQAGSFPCVDDDLTIACLYSSLTCNEPLQCSRSIMDLVPLCNCQQYKFACLTHGECVSIHLVCDGHNDCTDGSDEKLCIDRALQSNRIRTIQHAKQNHSSSSSRKCHKDQFRCTTDGNCIAGFKRCNNINDCSDFSDEFDCPHYDYNDISFECEPNEFDCGSSCIPCENKCNGYPDCPDESDEYNCHTESCNDDEFECDINLCILLSDRCNGIKNCDDGTDEENCNSCPFNHFYCESGGQCIPRNKTCNGKIDCPDGSDEMQCDHTCKSHEWKCDNNQCIPSDFLCDKHLDCYDKSDESERTCGHGHAAPHITPDDCGTEEFYCDQNCLPYHYRCDGVHQCMDKTDELNCRANASTTPSPLDIPTRYPCPELTCAFNGKCYKYSEKCDGTADCDDNSDERNCSCKENEFHCFDHQLCINKTQRCDGFYDCKDFSDEQNCFGCEPDQYQCSNGACAHQCDGRPECFDGADEEGCPYSECQSYQWRCDNGQCINSYARCDGNNDCGDSSDERSCHRAENDGVQQNKMVCTLNSFRCLSGHCIPLEQRCDNNYDCPYDISDETHCEKTNEIDSHAPPSDPQLNLVTYPNSQIIKESREVVFRCRDEGPTRAKVKWSRPGGRPLPRGVKDRDGRLEIPNIRVEDSGEYVCEAVGYPAFTRGQSVSVSLTVEKYNPILDRPASACAYHEATCMNGECIDKNRICDGIPHCSDGSDEYSCSHGRKCNPNQFRCKNSKCVDRVWRCDGENDCGDNSDEESCDPNPSDAPCRHDEFQCRSAHCIPKSFHCDGTNDCRDGSDEFGCVAPAVISPPPPSVDLHPGSALNISCRATGVPTPIIVWRLNWGHVPEKCEFSSENGLGNLYCPNMQKQDSGAYSCEIINIKGGIFVVPDTIVTIISDVDVCPTGTFNNQAVRKDECINCFCFGISNQCKSAELYIYALPPPITSHKVVGLETTGSGIKIGEYEGHDLITTRHGVQFRVSNVPYSSRQIPYLELPSEYSGNQLKSYGGFIKYTLSYYGHGRPITAPDVVLIGNGYHLTHRSLQPPISNGQTQYNVQFSEGQWEKFDGRLATRSEIMMVLAGVERILIRLEYIDANEREVELTHITLDSAAVDDRGLGSASLVEECTCPTGYMGYSCERCAPGFIRQKSGPWLGRCIPDEIALCSAGTYGDPSRGIPCQPCPCPLTNPGNNFAKGCSLGSDGMPVCNCQVGYTGNRCQHCAPGYEGNPMQPGDYCKPRSHSECHPDGTQNIGPNGVCECKTSVTGPRCDMCAPNSFHLNSYSYSGCIECFCMGVSQTCSSSNYYRDLIRSGFSSRDRGSHGFSLVNDYENEGAETFDIRQTNDQLVFRGASDTADVLYWSLPQKFLGDKVTAYGGVLNYTVRFNPLPGGLRSRNVAPDVVIKSKNDIVVLHYNKNEISPSVAYTYTIPIVENSWQRNDGNIINREHLLMALADIEAIFIKATYTTTTQEAALVQVTMDTAVRTNTGRARAVEVEQCICPTGYTGLSCEDCAPGFKRSEEQGLYLGICELCECNGHSNECDPESGLCFNCRDNTHGPQCDQCIDGFEGNATVGTPTDCRPSGPAEQSLCERCDQRGVLACDNNYCRCKSNVIGDMCDRCRPGTFNLNKFDPRGCEECYCSGVTASCTHANYFKDYIPLDFISSNNKPTITDAEGMLVDSENLDFNINDNIYSYLTPSYTQKYWSLPGSLLGDQIKSYGANLEFKLTVESEGQFEPGKDVIIMGNGVTIYWSRPPGGRDLQKFVIPLNSQSYWYRQDAYSSPYEASKSDIMTVLANIDHILIRATPSIPTRKSSLSDVVLETAVSSGTVPTQIEFCSCPDGYEGTSCENCSPLHYRNLSISDRGPFGACLPCFNWCGEQIHSCEMSGSAGITCHCKNGYKGDRCQSIDLDEKYPSSTQRPQPVIEVRIDSPTLSIIPVGGSVTLSCTAMMMANRIPVNVKWMKLDDNLPYDAEQIDGTLTLYNLKVHDSGVYVCQARSGNEVAEKQVPVNVGHAENTDRQAPSIHIRPTNQFDVRENEEVRAICEDKYGGSRDGRSQTTFEWTRIDGAMPQTAYISNGQLNIQYIQKSDAGSYLCRGYNAYGTSEETVQIYVRSDAHEEVEPEANEVVAIEPPSYNGRIGEKIRLLCELRKRFIVEYEWFKDDRKLQWSQNVHINENEVTIRNAAPQDSGNYVCRVLDTSNGKIYSSSSHVYIEDDTDFPYPPDNEVHVKPLREKHIVVQGQDLEIACEATGQGHPILKWTRLHEPLDSSIQIIGNILSIKNAQPHHRGLYICIAEGRDGSHESESHTIIDVEPREHPQVEIYPTEAQSVSVGDRAIIDCRAVAGIPEPVITWRRTDGRPLPSSIEEEYRGRLLINDIKLEDAGIYECVAENVAGRASGSTSIQIVQAPHIQIQPNTTEIRLTEGEELRLICTAHGIPPPKVMWSSEQNSVSNFNTQLAKAEIYIPRTSLNDAKLYTCEAENSVGSDVRYVNVRIEKRRGDTGIHEVDEPTTWRVPSYHPTRMPDYNVFTRTHAVEIGEESKLSCTTIDERNQETSLDIHWTRVDGKPLPPNSMTEGNDLIFYDINYDTAGIYRCNVIGPNGNPMSYFDVDVIIRDLPRITLSPEMPMVVRLGETVEVYCNVSGAEPIRVEWHGENHRPMPHTVRIDGPYLRFHSIKYSDAGRYYCSAQNHLGNATKVAEVIVNRGETVYDRPPTHLTRHEIQEGQNINLKCDIGNFDSGLRYIWKKANGVISPSAYESNNVLSLRDVNPYDEGRYICQIYSVDNQLISETFVELTVKPSQPANVHTLPVLKVDQQEASLRQGESTEVECQSSDKRYPDVIWERADGRPLPRNVRQIGNKLVAVQVDLMSAGTYVCKCKTDEGDLYTTSFELNVEEIKSKGPKTVHATVGSNTSLKCNTQHYPTSYRWTKQHGSLPQGKNPNAVELNLNNVQANDAGTYICTSTHSSGSTEQVYILAVTGLIPKFEQNPLSYMSFPMLDSAYMKFNFDITFKPTQPNGLILYNGQRKGSGDFIALSLNNRYPEFRFDFGAKPNIVRSENPVTLNEWHTIKVSRNKRDGLLIVDDQMPVAFPPALGAGLDLLEDLYIGGVAKWEDVAPNATESKVGFVGCISQLILQDRPIELMKEAKHTEGISSCQPCAEKPCHNNGVCVEGQTSTGYLCVCDEGFTGKQCGIKGDKCSAGICGSGRCQDTDFGISCFCPLNKTGDRCQYNENLDGYTLAFKDKSYAAYKTPRPSKLNIKLSIKPKSLEDSIILYVAESEHANGDFFAVLLKNKHIVLIINTGASVKPVIVTSHNTIEANKWTDIEIGRRVGEAILKVGDEMKQTGKQSGPARSLFLKTHLFVGGVDERILLNRDVDIVKGFDGCITNLEESGRKIKMISDLLDGANIYNCEMSPPVDRVNEILPAVDRVHEILPAVDRPQNPCMSDPCENYGTCVADENAGFKCYCPLGYSGIHCNEHVQLDTNCQFNGDGYLELNRSALSEHDQQLETFIAMLFSTKSPNGLLIWWGQPTTEQYNGQDFIALAINEGILEFSFRLDGEENTVQSAYTKVDDGSRHIAIIKRHGNEVSLELDHLIEHGETKRPTARNKMILSGNIFIGGAPDLASFTGKRYTHAFNGCIRVVETAEGGPVHLGHHAISALNVDVCPSDDEVDYEGPEPPVV